MYREAGVTGKGVGFVFTDAEIKEESFLEVINNLLSTGEVPGMYPKDEIEAVVAAAKQQDCKSQYTGVSWHSKGRSWCAVAPRDPTNGSKQAQLGFFDTDEAAAHLAGCARLRSVILSDCSITDVAAERLSACAKLQSVLSGWHFWTQRRAQIVPNRISDARD
mgnify:CR=1 FL=1